MKFGTLHLSPIHSCSLLNCTYQLYLISVRELNRWICDRSSQWYSFKGLRWFYELGSLTSKEPTATRTGSSAIAEGPHDASCQFKSCQLPRNSAETTCTTSPEQIEVMMLEGYSWAICNKHVHSTMTRSSRFHCFIGVIKKPTMDELWISPLYRWLAVAKFSKSTM